jgi:hypothetical protein
MNPRQAHNPIEIFHPIVPAKYKEHVTMGIVIIGGLIDSVIGIVNGAVVAITSAGSAVILPLLPI